MTKGTFRAPLEPIEQEVIFHSPPCIHHRSTLRGLDVSQGAYIPATCLCDKS